jgi:hypothetical protein
VTKPPHPLLDDEDKGEVTKDRDQSAVSLIPERRKGHDTKTSTENQPSQTTTYGEEKDVIGTGKNSKGIEKA